jgi:biotin operon repressor
MDRGDPPDLRIEGWLKTLGVDRLCQWDVLVFLHRHHASLVSGEHIARLLGYATAPVMDALDGLESLGFVGRSRVDQGVRLYQITAPADSRRGDALDRLLPLADSRPVRLFLARQLQRGERPNPNAGHYRLHHGEGSATWLKAI